MLNKKIDNPLQNKQYLYIMIIASNLHIGSYFMQHSASEMSKPYSTRSVSNMETFNVFIQLAWLQIYKEHGRELVNKLQ